MLGHATQTNLEYGQRDVANALKHSLIGQFVKFFLPIGQSNISKHLHHICSESSIVSSITDFIGRSIWKDIPRYL